MVSAAPLISPPKRLALTWSAYQAFSIRVCRAAFPGLPRLLLVRHSLESETVVPTSEGVFWICSRSAVEAVLHDHRVDS